MGRRPYFSLLFTPFLLLVLGFLVYHSYNVGAYTELLAYLASMFILSAIYFILLKDEIGETI
jgi:hypothetical protein